MNQTLDNVFTLGFEIWSSGPTRENSIAIANAIGRFEPVIGEAENGFPVYKQVHSREIPSKFNILLYR